MLSFGYAGKTLEVDLATNKIAKLDTRKFPLSNYLGGKGLGAYILYRQVPKRVDPLGPKNILMFLTGPLNGICPGTKTCVVGKSPLTETFCDSYMGGHFASELKYAGYDGIIIKGKAEKPVYLSISDHEVEINSAADLWGLDAIETEKKLHETKEGSRIACIGPAGEKLVKFACINTEFFRHAGRGGLGTVMGSKNLKAIAVRGRGSIEVKKSGEYAEIFKEAVKKLVESETGRLRIRWGTAKSVLFANECDLLPTKNFREATFPDGAEKLSAEAMKKSFWVKSDACTPCPLSCEKLGVLRTGSFAGTVLGGVEYETVGMLGSNCGIDNLEAVVYANELCDRLGLDTISTGNIVGFVMDCYEHRILSAEDLGGLKANFGSEEALFGLIKMIASRQGIGDLLAEGVKRASEKIGKGAEVLAVHVKGLETPAWDARASPGMALAYATADRGGCHQRAWPIGAELSGRGPAGEVVERYSTKSKAAIVKYLQDFTAVTDCLVACDFTRDVIGLKGYAKMLELAMGKKLDAKELLTIGERVWNLIRLFNVREGFSRRDDTIPVMMSKPLLSGVAKGKKITKEMLVEMLDEYYQLRGWSKNGKPTKKKLVELGLGNLVKDTPPE